MEKKNICCSTASKKTESCNLETKQTAHEGKETCTAGTCGADTRDK